MTFALRMTVAFAALAVAWSVDVHAAAPVAKRTVCTITVNSSDEKDMFKARLPASQYRFVELVERGRADWLESACRQGVQCDLLVISGHFDGDNNGNNVFYSDQLAASEFLPVAEMERASCSESCPGLFSQLQEVYLFGCNTLNADTTGNASSEVARALVRAGHSAADARKVSQALQQIHAESSRDRMRRIFTRVPVIYGFSSVAPLGPQAASLLGRYLQPPALADVGSGRASSRLLRAFSGESMVSVSGLRDSDPRAQHRRDVCQFVDDRLTAADKLVFIHGLLRRETAEVRMFLERIEGLFAALTPADASDPRFLEAHAAIARDTVARDAFMRFADDADLPAIRARMIGLAAKLGWLSEGEMHAETMRMIGELIARDAVGPAEVDTICGLNQDHALDGERGRLALLPAAANRVANSAVLACLGSPDGRARVLQALTGGSDADVKIAEVVLGHRPIDDVAELRDVASAIARMPGSSAQVRALDTLGRHRLRDAETLAELARLFPIAQNIDVQRAIAAVIIRSDYELLPKPETVAMLSLYRFKSTGGNDSIDILIRRLQESP
jgi:hypothetical protein